MRVYVLARRQDTGPWVLAGIYSDVEKLLTAAQKGDLVGALEMDQPANWTPALGAAAPDPTVTWKVIRMHRRLNLESVLTSGVSGSEAVAALAAAQEDAEWTLIARPEIRT